MKIRFMIIALIVAICSCNSPKDSTYNQQAGDPDPSLSRPGKGFEIEGRKQGYLKRTVPAARSQWPKSKRINE